MHIELDWIRDFFPVQPAEEDHIAFDPADVKCMLEAAVKRWDEPANIRSSVKWRAPRPPRPGGWAQRSLGSERRCISLSVVLLALSLLGRFPEGSWVFPRVSL